MEPSILVLLAYTRIHELPNLSYKPDRRICPDVICCWSVPEYSLSL